MSADRHKYERVRGHSHLPNGVFLWCVASVLAPAPLRSRIRAPPYSTLRTFSACSPFLPLVGS